MGGDLLYRLRALFRRGRMDAELREELEFHVEREAAKYRDAGVAPDDAMRRARLALGGTAQVEQRVRDSRGVRLLNDVAADLRFAVRQLRRSPAFTVTAVLTLALSIGATIAMVSIVKSVLLAPLPYPQQDRLVGVAFTGSKETPNNEQAGNTANFVKQHAQSFQSMTVYGEGTSGANLATGGNTTEGAVQVAVQSVDRSFFPTLGVEPVLGRNFSADEDRHNGPKAILLSYGVWQRMFNGDRSVLGEVVHLNGESVTIAGVMPEAFSFGSDDPRSLSSVADIWQPLQLDPSDPGYSGTNYNMIARLRDGVTLQQARQEMASFNEPLYKEFPYLAKWLTVTMTTPTLTLWPLKQVLVSNIRTSLLALTGAVGAVLFVACLNLAGLMAARASKRQREIALRTALGASRGAILRLLISESFLLALAGSAMGVLGARLMVPALLASSPIPMPRTNAGDVLTLLALTLPVVFAVTMVCGLLPSWLTLRRNSSANLQAGHEVGATVSDARVGRVLLVTQTAVTVLLLCAASMLLAVFMLLRSTPSGVQPEHLTVAQVNLKGADYASMEATTRFVDKVLERLRRIPGVQHAAAVNGFPLDRGLNIAMPPTGPQQKSFTVELRLVTPDYFRTVGIPLLVGRDVAESDREDAPPVIVLSQAMVKKLGLGADAVGQQLPGMWAKDKNRKVTVIGVVADARSHSLAEDPALLAYEPFTQQSDKAMKALNGWFRTSFAIRSAANTDLGAAVEQAIHDADPGIPVSRYVTMQSIIDHSLARPRFFSSLVTAFAGFALVLTVIGLFGLLSYQVTQRTREIGVRIALGATREQILTFIMRRGLSLTVLGLAVGAAASLMLPKVIGSILDSLVLVSGKRISTGYSSTAAALGMACAAMLIAAVLASYLPARRASEIEPLEALRTE